MKYNSTTLTNTIFVTGDDDAVAISTILGGMVIYYSSTLTDINNSRTGGDEDVAIIDGQYVRIYFWCRS